MAGDVVKFIKELLIFKNYCFLRPHRGRVTFFARAKKVTKESTPHDLLVYSVITE